jgi:hypothetical protein
LERPCVACVCGSVENSTVETDGSCLRPGALVPLEGARSVFEVRHAHHLIDFQSMTFYHAPPVLMDQDAGRHASDSLASCHPGMQPFFVTAWESASLLSRAASSKPGSPRHFNDYTHSQRIQHLAFRVVALQSVHAGCGKCRTPVCPHLELQIVITCSCHLALKLPAKSAVDIYQDVHCYV